MARKVRPISELSDEEKAERRLARKLGFKNEDTFRAWRNRMRNLPVEDNRHLAGHIADDNFTELNRLRKLDKRSMTPAREMLRKFDVLVVNNNASVHMSAFAFEDRYREAIQALLADPRLSDYRKRQLRAMQRDLGRRMQAGDITPGIREKFRRTAEEEEARRTGQERLF